MSYTIVVARYNEDIRWLRNQWNHCVIMNKGTPFRIPNEILLTNVGREADSYLQYIISHYNHLPDVVVFTQARISDHKGSDDVSYLVSIKNEAIAYGKSKNFFTHTDIGQCIHFDKHWNLRGDSFFLQDNYKDNKPILFHDWFVKHILPEYPNPMHIYGNAIFALRKELILKHPLSYYQSLLLEVNHHINSTEGHFFERSWFYLF